MFPWDADRDYADAAITVSSTQKRIELGTGPTRQRTSLFPAENHEHHFNRMSIHVHGGNVALAADFKRFFFSLDAQTT